MQTWPSILSRQAAAVPAARATSAESSTMNASEPPSSSTTGLMLRPACSPTADPARSEPVSVTPRTRGSAM